MVPELSILSLFSYLRGTLKLPKGKPSEVRRLVRNSVFRIEAMGSRAFEFRRYAWHECGVMELSATEYISTNSREGLISVDQAEELLLRLLFPSVVLLPGQERLRRQIRAFVDATVKTGATLSRVPPQDTAWISSAEDIVTAWTSFWLQRGQLGRINAAIQARDRTLVR